MSTVGLSSSSSSVSRPRLPGRSSSSLIELITSKSIDQISALTFVPAHLELFDEGVDDFRYPGHSFFAFPQPINTPHSRVRTIRVSMPSSKESGVGEKVSAQPQCRHPHILNTT